MKKELKKYFCQSQNLLNEGKNIFEIGNSLRKKGASLAVSVVSLKKIGFTFEEIDEFLQQDTHWKDEEINLINLFLDYVELDDDLITD